MSAVEATAPWGRRAPLPALSFDSEGYRPKDKLEVMNEFSRGLYEYSPNCEAPIQDAASTLGPCLRLKAWALGNVAAADFECARATAETTGHRVSEFSEQLFLRVFEAGHVKARSSGARSILHPGMIHLMNAQNAVTPIGVGRTMSLRFSYGSVGYDPHRHARLLSYSAETGLGRIVRSAVYALFDMLPTASVDEMRAVDATLAGLVRGLLVSGHADDETYAVVGSARSDAMRRYIEQHLQDTDLGTQRLCTAFAASRATVYRAFEPFGGVAGHIRSERLKAVYRELLTATPRYGVVRRIAENYGFCDSGAFARAFKRQHGMRPSDVVGQFGQTGAEPKVAKPLVDLAGPNLASFWSAGTIGHSRTKT